LIHLLLFLAYSFLEHNNIKDKPIPSKFLSPLQGKIEAYNNIVKNEFISVEVISSIDEGKQRYDTTTTNNTKGNMEV
jgi:hypothetical protein